MTKPFRAASVTVPAVTSVGTAVAQHECAYTSPIWYSPK